MGRGGRHCRPPRRGGRRHGRRRQAAGPLGPALRRIPVPALSARQRAGGATHGARGRKARARA